MQIIHKDILSKVFKAININKLISKDGQTIFCPYHTAKKYPLAFHYYSEDYPGKFYCWCDKCRQFFNILELIKAIKGWSTEELIEQFYPGNPLYNTLLSEDRIEIDKVYYELKTNDAINEYIKEAKDELLADQTASNAIVSKSGLSVCQLLKDNWNICSVIEDKFPIQIPEKLPTKRVVAFFYSFAGIYSCAYIVGYDNDFRCKIIINDNISGIFGSTAKVKSGPDKIICLPNEFDTIKIIYKCASIEIPSYSIISSQSDIKQLVLSLNRPSVMFFNLNDYNDIEAALKAYNIGLNVTIAGNSKIDLNRIVSGRLLSLIKKPGNDFIEYLIECYKASPNKVSEIIRQAVSNYDARLKLFKLMMSKKKNLAQNILFNLLFGGISSKNVDYFGTLITTDNQGILKLAPVRQRLTNFLILPLFMTRQKNKIMRCKIKTKNKSAKIDVPVQVLKTNNGAAIADYIWEELAKRGIHEQIIARNLSQMTYFTILRLLYNIPYNNEGLIEGSFENVIRFPNIEINKQLRIFKNVDYQDGTKKRYSGLHIPSSSHDIPTLQQLLAKLSTKDTGSKLCCDLLYSIASWFYKALWEPDSVRQFLVVPYLTEASLTYTVYLTMHFILHKTKIIKTSLQKKELESLTETSLPIALQLTKFSPSIRNQLSQLPCKGFILADTLAITDFRDITDRLFIDDHGYPEIDTLYTWDLSTSEIKQLQQAMVKFFTEEQNALSDKYISTEYSTKDEELMYRQFMDILLDGIAREYFRLAHSRFHYSKKTDDYIGYCSGTGDYISIKWFKFLAEAHKHKYAPPVPNNLKVFENASKGKCEIRDQGIYLKDKVLLERIKFLTRRAAVS